MEELVWGFVILAVLFFLFAVAFATMVFVSFAKLFLFLKAIPIFHFLWVKVAKVVALAFKYGLSKELWKALKLLKREIGSQWKNVRLYMKGR